MQILTEHVSLVCLFLTCFVLFSLSLSLVNEKESKAQLHSAREKLNEIRAARIEQETRVREASNLFLKVNWVLGVRVRVTLSVKSLFLHVSNKFAMVLRRAT